MQRMVDTVLWKEESDRYTERAKNLRTDSTNFKEAKIEFAKSIYESITEFMSPSLFLDIGCAYGASIRGLSNYFPKSRFVGIDPGVQSTKIAKNDLADKDIHFINAYSHAIPCADNSFDVVILSMVLQWIPRRYLIQTIAEIDRVLKYEGAICINEFYPNSPIMSKSRHNEKVFIFKEDYSACIESFPWFKVIFRKVFNINQGEHYQRCITVLRKFPIEEVYTIKEKAE